MHWLPPGVHLYFLSPLNSLLQQPEVHSEFTTQSRQSALSCMLLFERFSSGHKNTVTLSCAIWLCAESPRHNSPSVQNS